MDLDLAVCGNKPLSLDKMSLLKEAFDESSLPWKVDVVDYSTVSADFQHIIDAHKIRLK